MPRKVCRRYEHLAQPREIRDVIHRGLADHAAIDTLPPNQMNHLLRTRKNLRRITRPTIYDPDEANRLSPPSLRIHAHTSRALTCSLVSFIATAQFIAVAHPKPLTDTRHTPSVRRQQADKRRLAAKRDLFHPLNRSFMETDRGGSPSATRPISTSSFRV